MPDATSEIEPHKPLEPPHVESTPLVGRALSQVNPTRSLILMACGAVVGLGIAGFGLFTAKGTQIKTVPPEDVALVNNRPVLVSDFVAQVEAENGTPFGESTPAQRKKVIDEMIREELFVQRGLELDFPASDPDTRAALVAAVEQQVAADVTAQQPSEAQLRDYYAQHRAKYATDGTMTLHEFVNAVPTRTPEQQLASARELVTALRAGTAADQAAAKAGFKESGRVSDGEEFYFAAKIHLGAPLFALAATLKNGQVSDPQVAADGPHVLAMIKNNMPVPQSFEDAREQVFFDYKKDAETKLQKADEGFLRSKADIKIAKEYQ